MRYEVLIAFLIDSALVPKLRSNWEILYLCKPYKREIFRFEFKSVGERNQALKLLERNGFDAYPVEDLRGYVVKLDKFSNYAPVLKNLVAYVETPKEQIFLMKDIASVEVAIKFGAEIYDSLATF